MAIYILFGIAQVLGIAAAALIGAAGYHNQGYLWENVGKRFDFHPLFMTIGLLFFYSQAIMVYRVFPHFKKINLKIAHACLHIIAILFAGIALGAVFSSMSMHIQSLHSFCGIVTVGLFIAQYIVGFISFLFPGLPMSLRSKIITFHVYFGIIIFLMAVITAMMGASGKSWGNEKITPLLYKSFGVSVFLLAVTVLYLVTKPEYKRQPRPDDNHSSHSGTIIINHKESIQRSLSVEKN